MGVAIQNTTFNKVIETLYKLSLDERQEINNLLQHNIADERRTEIEKNCKAAQKEFLSGKMKFSSNVDQLKKLL